MDKKIIGFTASAFDLFHTGHVLMLKEAKEQCDYLICGLHTNPSIDRQEKNQPIQSTYERFEQLRNCQFVDEIIPYDTEEDLLNYLSSHQSIIDVRILGEEYKNTLYTGYELDIEPYYNTRRHTYSSTSLRKRCK